MINLEERTWKNAPAGVRDVRSLTILALVIYFLYVVMGLITIRDGGIFILLGCTPFILFELWMLRVLRLGKPSGYYIQMVLSILGLLWLPLGTVINIIILTKWFKPETKAWFGV